MGKRGQPYSSQGTRQPTLLATTATQCNSDEKGESVLSAALSGVLQSEVEVLSSFSGCCLRAMDVVFVVFALISDYVRTANTC